MRNNLMPLYYAIVKQFMDGNEYDASEIVRVLEPNYGGYRLLTRRGVEEALATAKENGLLDESHYDVDDADDLRVFYRVNDFGREMIDRYIGMYHNPA